jgi:hypothetical protein
MLLIIVLGLIANLTLVFSDCVIENHVKNFDFTKVGIILLTRLLKHAAVKTAAWVFIFRL